MEYFINTNCFKTPTLGWPSFPKSPKKSMLAVFYDSYGIMEWEYTFGFVSRCKSTLPKHREIYIGNSEKYNQESGYILIFGNKNNFVGYLR